MLLFFDLAPDEIKLAQSAPKLELRNARIGLGIVELYFRNNNYTTSEKMVQIAITRSDIQLQEWISKQTEIPNTWLKFKRRLLRSLKETNFRKVISGRQVKNEKMSV